MGAALKHILFFLVFVPDLAQSSSNASRRRRPHQPPPGVGQRSPHTKLKTAAQYGPRRPRVPSNRSTLEKRGHRAAEKAEERKKQRCVQSSRRRCSLVAAWDDRSVRRRERGAIPPGASLLPASCFFAVAFTTSVIIRSIDRPIVPCVGIDSIDWLDFGGEVRLGATGESQSLFRGRGLR